jgi:hydrogenase nickel incorporation protein HypA/HybF
VIRQPAVLLSSLIANRRMLYSKELLVVNYSNLLLHNDRSRKSTMHELPVTEGILTLALTTARQAGRERITAIDLVIGDLSSIVDDSIQFYFDLLSQGTAAQGAALHFRREAARLICRACGRRGEMHAPLPHTCPACGSSRLQVVGGQAFYVESIEVADEDTGSPVDSERE